MFKYCYSLQDKRTTKHETAAVSLNSVVILTILKTGSFPLSIFSEFQNRHMKAVSSSISITICDNMGPLHGRVVAKYRNSMATKRFMS